MIKQRRVVPDRPDYNHAGQHASLAEDKDGCRAWGFGQTETEADEDAFRKVNDLKEKLEIIRHDS